MGWLKRMIAWAVAGAELEELERWRVECAVAERWLAEFPDARHALQYVSGWARGDADMKDLHWLRERMRSRRDAGPGQITASMLAPRLSSGADLDRLAALPLMSDTDIAKLKQQWSVAGAVSPPGELVAATDWDVAEHMRELDQARQRTCDAVDNTLANHPTHFDGLFPPAPRRVAYKFLSPGCDARS